MGANITREPDERVERPGRTPFLHLKPLSFDLGDMAVQIVAVALGVILGFAATSWNEHERQRELLHATVGNIIAELSSNKSGMSKVLRGHFASADALAALATSSRRSGFIPLGKAQTTVGSGRFSVNIPLDVAWQIAQNDQGLTLLPYKDRYDLGWIYQLQRFYFSAEDRYRTSLLTVTEPPNGNYYFQIVDLANQEAAVVSQERQLMTLYETSIETLRHDK